jgi:TPR repeat protein
VARVPRGIVMSRRPLLAISLLTACCIGLRVGFLAVEDRVLRAGRDVMAASVGLSKGLFEINRGMMANFRRTMEAAERCDALLASTGTMARRTHAPGTDGDDNDAISVCWTAVAWSPNDAHLLFQLARAFALAKQYGEAAVFYRKAAYAGSADAMYNLAVMYEEGRGAAKDETEAARLYRQAADAGDVDAMNNLGVMYEEGRGIAKDEAGAVRLYRMAADAGVVDAMYNLGAMYEEGRGVAPDPAEARKWYEKAAKLGDEDAQAALKDLQ